jgi:hypothetical protein
MATLSSQDRKEMPKKEFAGPGRSFPISDPNHARLAISGATRSERAGNISSSEEASIKAKARAKLGGKEGGKSEAPAHGDCPGGAACKAAMDKVHPGHAHRMMEHAASGKAGPEMQQMAQQAMQGPAAAAEGEQPPPAQRPSMFSGQSDNDQDDQQDSAPASSGSMFSGGR